MLIGKTALITGAGSGIGLAIAREFITQGATVFRAFRSAEKIEQIGEREWVIPADVSQADSVEVLFAKILEIGTKLDILVNNAGMTKDGLLIRMKDEDWDNVLNVNLKGAFLCTRTAAKIMIKQRTGTILNITSVIGQIGNVGQANYAASKAGLIGLTKSAAKELASRNIRVNAIAPGFITTRMTDGLSEEWRKTLLDQIPLGRFGKPEDVAHLAVFLVSDQSAYITGQVLRVDGGMVL